MKKTTIAMLVAAISAGVYASQESSVFKFSSTQGIFKPLDFTPKFNEHNAFQLESGSLTFRVKSGQKFGTFFGVADPNSHVNYLGFYSSPKNGQDTIGVEIRTSSGHLIDNAQVRTTIPLSLTDYHNITYTFDKDNQQINIYIDGVKKQTHNASKFFANIPNLSNAFLGETRRLATSGFNTMRFTGDIFYADFDKKVLSEQQVADKHQKLTELQNYSLAKREVLGARKTVATPIFSPNQEGAKNYRIPSLLTTKNGVVIAAIDKRNQHASDWGNIDTVIRRSLDGGKTWEHDQVLVDLVSQSYGQQNAAFLIDPLMVQDKNTGRIFMIVDMFPEMRGLFGLPAHGEGTGYKNINGKSYRLLTDNQNNQYTVREDGFVYDELHQKTEYRVVIQGDPSRAYHDLGDLYQGDTRVGNIFLNTKDSNNDSAPLSAKKTSYLWMIHSDDDGATWSNPVDLTPQVKADWMQFLGVGPGNGIQLKNGNLVMPVYYTNNVGGLNSQSAAVIISKDGGQTWERGESPIDRWEAHNGGSRKLNASNKQLTESQVIELDNGDLKMFSRNLVSNKVLISTSKDGGYTWLNSYQLDDILLEPYSQLSVIKYSKKINGKEIILFANPHSDTRSRVNGKVWMGEVQEDGNIEWKYNTSINTGNYAYNSLTELPNGQIGLLYEGASSIDYVSLNLQELVWHDNRIYRDKRDSDTPKEFALNSPIEETFYKIGDGEMIKVGVGVNPAHLIIQEGSVTLNQQADSNNAKQAFQSVTVERNAKVRLASPDQVALNRLYLNGGTLDLNGQSLTVSAPSSSGFRSTNNTNLNTGLTSEVLEGNILNEDPNNGATLVYTLSGNRSINGQLGGKEGSLNLQYEPITSTSNLTLLGNTVLNVVDVKSGVISYAPKTEHQASTLNLSDNTSASFGSSTISKINQIKLNANSRLVLNSEATETTRMLANTNGSGTLEKQGSGLVKLEGNLSHSGRTILREGALELDGQLSQGTLELYGNTIFGGNANVDGDTILKQGSLIAPGFNQNNDSFASKIVKFANVLNEGARVLLRVNHNDNEIGHDQLIVKGNITSETAIPVDVQFVSNHTGNTDSNNNGQYDVDEGLSLIQVLGQTELEKFVLDRKLDRNNNLVDLYQYTLVGVDKSVSKPSSTTVGNERFFDFRLQTLLIDADGNSPTPVIRTVSKNGSSLSTAELPMFSELETVKLLLAEKQKELQQKELAHQQAVTLAEKLAKDHQASEQARNEANQAKEAAIANLHQVIKEKATLEKTLNSLNDKLAKAQLNLTAKENALALKEAEYQKTVELVKRLENDNQASEQALQQANLAKQAAENNLQKVREEKLLAETALNNLLQQNQQNANNATKAYRAALHQKVPSYLVANHAMFMQGDNLRRQFMDNIWETDTKGFYVNHQASNTNYRSDLSFSQYGYGYKAKQHNTLFGGFASLTDSSELHGAIGFNRQTVTPQAVDGKSETRYKSTSFMLGLHNKWDNFILNTMLGYHLHRGKVSTAGNSNIARIDGRQLQLSGEMGYKIPLGQWSITPVLGLSYQQLRSDVTDHQEHWNVAMSNYNIFSQQFGTNINWQNEIVKLSAGAYYEHHNGKPKTVGISAGNQTAYFTTGRKSNDILFRLNSEFALTKHLSLGLRFEHRHSLSKAKLKQTQFGGKLEYKF